MGQEDGKRESIGKEKEKRKEERFSPHGYGYRRTIDTPIPNITHFHNYTYLVR